MIKESKKTKLPADLFSRNTLYGLVSGFLLKTTLPSTQLQALDVGGYGGKLAWFLPPQLKLTILDRKPAPQNGATTYIQGDACQLPFEDNSFDFVFSSDLLEHLDQTDRLQAVSEMFRVSRRFVIIGAPFQSIFNEQAEKYINEQFKQYSGSDHPFLIEHISNQLPDLEEIEQHLISKNISYHKIGEGNIYNWYLQQLVTGTELNEPDLASRFQQQKESKMAHDQQKAPQTFAQFFNENLFKLGNFRTPCYRTVFVCDKQSKVDRQQLIELVEEHNNFHSTTYFLTIKKAFDQIRELIEFKNQQLISTEENKLESLVKVSEIEVELMQKNSELKLIGNQLSEAQIILNEKQFEIAELTAEKEAQKAELMERIKTSEQKLEMLRLQLESNENLITRLRQELSEFENGNKALTQLIVQKEQSQGRLEHDLKEKNAQIGSLQSSLGEYKTALETVLNSRSWKLVKIYGKFKNVLYTQPKYFLRKGFSVLFKLGPVEFLKRLKRKIFSPRKPAAMTPYEMHLEKNRLGPRDIKNIREHILTLEYKPMISILVPVYNVEAKWLRLCINSVLNQYYDKWELILVDDCSTKPHIKPLLEEYAALDNRIRIHFRQNNGGIVKASNTAFKLARGAYVGLLDNDDELTPDALYEIVKNLQTKRHDLLYSDEDKIEMDGHLSDPHFKSGFNPDLLFSCNYICHFMVIRRKIMEEVGAFREGTDGSQDYDLVLRVTDKPRSILHIPKVLYHWRKIPGSTAATVDAKDYVFNAAKKALSDAIKRRGIKGTVEDGLWKGSYRVKREIIGNPLVSIIIPFRDEVGVLKVAVESIFEKTTWQNYEILLVNNGSEKLETFEYMKEVENCPRVKLLHYNAPFNFSAINNFAAQIAKGDYLLLLNNDTEVIEPSWIEAMLEHAQRPEVGVVGSKLLYPVNKIQHAGVLVGIGGVANHSFAKQESYDLGYFGNASLTRDYSAVTFACAMIRRDIYEKFDGLDEENLAVAFNDVDFCLRVREKGYLVVFTPYSLLYHHESLSRGYNVNFNEEYYLRRRHASILKDGDPFYNHNLTRERFDFSLKVLDTNRD